MISIDVIRQAILLTKNPYAKHVSTAEQVANSLKVYIERKEFDGSLESAIECLELAGYEIES